MNLCVRTICVWHSVSSVNSTFDLFRTYIIVSVYHSSTEAHHTNRQNERSKKHQIYSKIEEKHLKVTRSGMRMQIRVYETSTKKHLCERNNNKNEIEKSQEFCAKENIKTIENERKKTEKIKYPKLFLFVLLFFFLFLLLFLLSSTKEMKKDEDKQLYRKYCDISICVYHVNEKKIFATKKSET